jgi:cell division protein FtsW
VTERLDMTLVLAWAALLLVGLVMVTSAAAGQAEGTYYYLLRHSLYLAVAVSVFLLVAVVPLRAWEMIHRPCLVLAFFLCLLVFLPGLTAVAKGAHRWIDLGLARFQPAEAAKLLAIIYLAGYIARTGDGLGMSLSALLKPVIWMTGLLAVILVQPDFGCAALIMAMSVGVLFVAGARFRDVGALGLASVAAFTLLAWTSPYRLARVNTFLDPWSDPMNSGWQLTQSLMAIGTGHLSGAGVGAGVQKLFYLPEAHTDFIFAVIAEEAGLLGSLALLAVFAVLVARVLAVARASARRKRMFQAYFALGLALCIGLQVLVNLGVNMGVLPTKGLALPLVSYGRSNLVVTLVSLGILLRIDRENAALEPGRPSKSR